MQNLQVQLVRPPVSDRHERAARCKSLSIIQINIAPFCMFFKELFFINGNARAWVSQGKRDIRKR